MDQPGPPCYPLAMRPIASPRVVLACLALLLGAGCTPVVMPMGPAIAPPALAPDAVVAADGARLPMRAYPPEGPPRAVLLALHGFNDHSGNFLADSIAALNAGGLLVYAYDQRGFGRSPNRGYWPGEATLARDAATAARLLRARHPGLPLFLMGESMGGAVAVVAGTSAAPPPVDGYVLLAPALWGRASMNAVMRGGLWVAARTMPVLGFQGGVGGIVASDNPAALRRLGRDPLVLRSTRVDAAVGLVDLMDAATSALPTCCRDATQRPVPVLVLYGGKDSVIPARPVRAALRRLPPDSPVRIGIHEEGFHLLLTDSNRAAVVEDILSFTANPSAPLPSGADRFAPGWLAR
ncbi:lysophospholipase [Falsiroseomonas sp. E2-1-a4]|uniref:alpha/beta hydrolase n=1 Tax=Falsiroseomonas sp. E2-1-a4 TaxID=3239299 RepID=UPI003F404021